MDSYTRETENAMEYQPIRRTMPRAYYRLRRPGVARGHVLAGPEPGGTDGPAPGLNRYLFLDIPPLCVYRLPICALTLSRFSAISLVHASRLLQFVPRLGFRAVVDT